ncbi:MAG: hypothetical protein NXI20_17960 [bacterium]|nr:hypothetical protein [bacterium]
MKVQFEISFWKWLAIFAYKRIAKPQGKRPDGIPFHRSEDAICTGFEPRKKKPGDYDDCDSDGHYLCFKCCHLSEQRRKELLDEV